MASREDLETRLMGMERRLRVVEDEQAIAFLKARYGELVDERYARGRPREAADLERIAAEIADLFTEDAVWDAGTLGVCQGRDQIRERMRTPSLHFSWHLFVKPRIRVEGDRASARWDILAPCTTTDDRAHWMAGVEDDEYERVDGAWLHSRMKLTVAFMAPHDRGWVKKRSAD